MASRNKDIKTTQIAYMPNKKTCLFDIFFKNRQNAIRNIKKALPCD